MQQAELGRNADDEQTDGQRGDQDPGHSGKEKQAPVQPARLRSISVCGKLRPCVRRTHCYGVAAAGCGVCSGLYESRPLVRTTINTAATATTALGIKSPVAADSGRNSPANPFCAVVALKEEWNRPTSSTLYPVALYSHIMTIRANICSIA